MEVEIFEIEKDETDEPWKSGIAREIKEKKSYYIP